MSENITVTPFDRRAEEKVARKGKEVERLRKLFNTWRKYAKLGFFVSLGIIFVLQSLLNRIAEPVNTFLSHIRIPLLGTPQIGKLGPMIMFFVWALFWLSPIIWYITHALKIILPWENGLITRLGAYNRTRTKGPCLTIWPFEGIKFVEVLDARIDIAEQPVYTSDNIKVGANAILWFRIINPTAAIYNVDEIKESVYDAAYAAIRGAAAKQEIKSINAAREEIGNFVKESFEEVTTKETSTRPQKKREDFKTRKEWLWFKLKDKLTFTSQIERQEQGWGIVLRKVEIQDFALPDDYEGQQRKVRIAELRVPEATSLRDARIKEAEGESQAKKLNYDAEIAGLKGLVEASGGKEAYVMLKVAEGLPEKTMIIGPETFAGLPTMIAQSIDLSKKMGQ